jgi:hypothetical protein
MPGKKNNRRVPAGNSGLAVTTSQDQSPEQTMSSEESAAAAGEPPQQEVHIDDGLAAIKAIDDLFDATGEKATKDPDTPLGDHHNEEGDHEEDDNFLLPESQNFVPGTAEDFTEKMRINGLRWRHELRKKVKNDPNLRELLQWVSNRPSSMDEPTHPLGQMLQEIKGLRGEVDQIIDMADGYVQIPIATFERHVYPSAFLRSYLRAMGETNDLVGGVESAFLYAFHMQYQTLPAERTTLTLQMLRASSVHAGDDLLRQVTDSAEMVSGFLQ